MRLTISRWLAAFACVASALVVMALLFADRNEPTWGRAGLPFEKPVDELRVTALSRARVQLTRLHLDRSALERWTLERRRDPSAVLVLDSALPDSVRRAYRAVLAPLVASLSADSGASRVAIFIHRDSSAAQEWATDTAVRVARRASTVERMIFTPNESGDGRCVAVISIGIASPLPQAFGNPLGPCAAVARYGSPGRVMLHLLDTLGWKPPETLASSYTASTATQDTRREARTYLYALALRCLTRSSACEELWHTDFERRNDSWTRPWLGERAVLHLGYASPSVSDPAAEAMDQWLNKLQRDMGDANFRAMWRGDESIDGVLSRSVGMSRSEWTRNWLASSFDIVATTPRPNGSELFWSLGLLTCFVVAGARGRAPRAR